VPQHRLAERHDQTGALGHAEEIAWRQQSEVRVVPAHGRFDSDDLAGSQVERRLVHQRDVVGINRAAQFHFLPVLQAVHLRQAPIQNGRTLEWIPGGLRVAERGDGRCRRSTMISRMPGLSSTTRAFTPGNPLAYTTIVTTPVGGDGGHRSFVIRT
jgi:hypothetical protein